jgi:ABC-type cobalt transport system substrate-binding protein
MHGKDALQVVTLSGTSLCALHAVQVGRRVFDIRCEGVTKVVGVDLVALAGPYQPWITSFYCTSTGEGGDLTNPGSHPSTAHQQVKGGPYQPWITSFYCTSTGEGWDLTNPGSHPSTAHQHVKGGPYQPWITSFYCTSTGGVRSLHTNTLHINR